MNYKNNVLMIAILCFGVVANAKTIDQNSGIKVFYNTDQAMQDGGVNRAGYAALQKAFKNSKPKDSIKTCNYKPDAICKIAIRERMPTIIKLPKYEWIEDYVLGDDVNFEIETFGVSKNAISLRGYYSGVDTSLNIIGGSGFIYSFYVKNNAVNAAMVSDFIVNIKTSDEVLEKIAQAKRFYQDRPVVNESLDDEILINVKNNALHTIFKKILPKDWNLNIDKKLQSRERLIDLVSENKTRRQVIIDLAADLKLKEIFYPKLRLLVITTLNQVIE